MLLVASVAEAQHITRLAITRKPPTLVGATNGGVVPLHGNFGKLGEYYITVHIGGKPTSVLVDTGSSDFAVSSVGCHGCNHKPGGQWYDPKGSPNSTALDCGWCSAHAKVCTGGCDSSCKARGAKKQCTFRAGYEDGTGFSAAGWLDDVKLGDMPTTRAAVGAIYESRMSDPKPVDGIIGLANVSESDYGAPTPIDALVSSGAMDNLFGLCLTEDGGQMYLGESATHMIETFRNASEDGEIGWTPRKLDGATPGLYAVTVTDIKIGGVSLGLEPHFYNDGDAIVDSGTSDFDLPETAMKTLKHHFASLCATQCLKGVCDCDSRKPLKVPIFENRCVDMELQDRDAYPTITVDFAGGLTIPYPPASYLRNGSQFCSGDPKKFTIEIEAGGKDGSGTILGDTFMRGYNVIHDRRTPQRIGFAKVPRGGACP